MLRATGLLALLTLTAALLQANALAAQTDEERTSALQLERRTRAEVVYGKPTIVVLVPAVPSARDFSAAALDMRRRIDSLTAATRQALERQAAEGRDYRVEVRVARYARLRGQGERKRFGAPKTTEIGYILISPGTPPRLIPTYLAADALYSAVADYEKVARPLES